MKSHPFVGLYNKEDHILIRSHNRRVSMKDSREIGVALKGKNLIQAQSFLERVIKLQQPVEFRRYTEGAGHKKNIKSGGRYPVNASKEILKLIKMAVKEAENRGWEADKVYVKGFVVSKGYRFLRPRRVKFRPQRAKSTHLYILCEVKKR